MLAGARHNGAHARRAVLRSDGNGDLRPLPRGPRGGDRAWHRRAPAACKDPDSWPQFELGADRRGRVRPAVLRPAAMPGRAFDLEAFHRVRRDGYAFLPGMEELLDELDGTRRPLRREQLPGLDRRAGPAVRLRPRSSTACTPAATWACASPTRRSSTGCSTAIELPARAVPVRRRPARSTATPPRPSGWQRTCFDGAEGLRDASVRQTVCSSSRHVGHIRARWPFVTIDTWFGGHRTLAVEPCDRGGLGEQPTCSRC